MRRISLSKEVINIYENLISKLNSLELQIAQIRQTLTDLPDGSLICARDGSYFKWYRSISGKQVYLSKKHLPLAQQLAWKKYLSLLLSDLKKEQKYFQHLLSLEDPPERKSDQLLIHPEFQLLLQPFFQPESPDLYLWMHSPYQKNPKHPEHLTHQTVAGIYVRSKSESLIATLLYHYKIPFRYECALTLDSVTVYPDFTIRHPLTGEFYYWEHFGMMDQASYAAKCFSKQQLYASHKIIPSIRLITTYETLDSPLNTKVTESIIQHYFL